MIEAERRFVDEWKAKHALARPKRTIWDWLAYHLARFSAWRVARKQRKCHHSVIGDSCQKCGWPLRMLNVYTPQGLKPSAGFLRFVRRELPPGVAVVQVEGEAPQLGLVGFELPPGEFMLMQSRLTRSLEARS